MANKTEVQKLPKAVVLMAAAVVLAGTVALGATLGGSGKNEPEIVTVSTLEKIINISELSTLLRYTTASPRWRTKTNRRRLTTMFPMRQG